MVIEFKVYSKKVPLLQKSRKYEHEGDICSLNSEMIFCGEM